MPWKTSNYCMIFSNARTSVVLAKLGALKGTGKITTLRVVIGPKTYGFIRFSSAMSIKQALQALNLGSDFDLKLGLTQSFAELVLNQPSPWGFGSIQYACLSNVKMDPADPYKRVKDRLNPIWKLFNTTKCDLVSVTGYSDLTEADIKGYFSRKLTFEEIPGRFGTANNHNHFSKIGYGCRQKSTAPPKEEHQPRVVVGMAPDEDMAPKTLETIISGKRFVHANSDVPPKRQRVILFGEQNKIPDITATEYKCKHIDISSK